MGISNRKITGIIVTVFCVLCIALLFVWIQKSSAGSDCADITNSPTSTHTPISTPTQTPQPPSFFDSVSSQAWEYYQEIALSSEYGDNDQYGLIKKWTDDIRIHINEFASEEDLSVIKNHVNAFNQIQGIPEVSITDDITMCNVFISFVTQSEMNLITEGRNEIAFGYTKIWWNQEAHITRANIYIVCDKQNVLERQHTILEEMTQALGLMNDSKKYEDSIFYVFYSDSILTLSELDWEVVRIHYSEEIKPGMNREDVLALFSPEY